MSTLELKKQVIALNTSANRHEKAGNNLLASWMSESAKYFLKKKEETEKALDSMCLGNYPEPSNRRLDFISEWLNYEEENLMNWDRG